MVRSEEEAMKLYNKHEKLIYATIHRRFNNPHFLELHGLTFDDLKQYGRLGLYRACQEYDSTKGTKFSSFAISNIVWSINVEAKRDSLGSVRRSTFDLSGNTSLDEELSDGEENLYDFIGVEESEYERVMIDSLLKSIGQNISKKLAEMISMRMDGYTFQEIGDHMGCSQQNVRGTILRNRDKVEDLLYAS